MGCFALKKKKKLIDNIYYPFGSKNVIFLILIKCPFGNILFSQNWNFFVESVKKKFKKKLNGIVGPMNSIKNVVKSMNSSKNKLNKQISWKF